MATLLPDYDWTFTSKHSPKPRGRNYPWDEWFDGGIRRLEQGTDFDGTGVSMERVIRTSANRKSQESVTNGGPRVRVRVRVEGDTAVVLQAHDDANGERRVTRTSKRLLNKAEKAAAKATAAKPAKRAAAKAAKPVAKTAKPVTKAAAKKAAPAKASKVVPTKVAAKKAVSKKAAPRHLQAVPASA